MWQHRVAILSADIDGDGYPDGILSTGGNDAFWAGRLRVSLFSGYFHGGATYRRRIRIDEVSLNSTLLPLDFDTLLEQGDLTDPTDDPEKFGAGIINAQKAVVAALAAPGGGQTPEERPFLGITPRSLNFGATLNELNFTLRNNAGGELTVLNIESGRGLAC